MTDLSHAAATDKRDALRARIEASERRNADRTLADQARSAADAAVTYTRKNPLTVIGAAVVLGAAVGLASRPGRRVASRALHTASGAISGAAATASSSVKSVTGHRPSRLRNLIGTSAMTYAMGFIDDVLDAAEEGRSKAGDLGDLASTKARRLSNDASHAAGSAADETRAFARRAQGAAAGAVRDLRRKAGV